MLIINISDDDLEMISRTKEECEFELVLKNSEESTEKEKPLNKNDPVDILHAIHNYMLDLYHIAHENEHDELMKRMTHFSEEEWEICQQYVDSNLDKEIQKSIFTRA